MKYNMSENKVKMPLQNPNIRKNNFDEVALGYTEEMAIEEAKRCLNCKNPSCKQGCPVQIDIPKFIKEVSEGNFLQAYNIITRNSSLPAICGRVCPQETQCEGKCVRSKKGEAVAIGRLERFVADWHSKNNTQIIENHVGSKYKVAIIGSGPSGLSCASTLAKLGYDVTIFEALHIAGGVLVYGIPEFRLPKSIVKQEIEQIKKMGVKIETNVVIGKTISIAELKQEYGFSAIFIGSGAGLPKFMNIPGENLKGVYSANEFLTRVNLMKAYKLNSTTPIKNNKKVAVVGGGNVAMDAARCALRLGAEKVYIVYRRGMEELPARKEEIEHAQEEGIEFKILTNPIEILGDTTGTVNKMICVEMELGEEDASGRRRPIVKENSQFELEVDCVIMALGTSPNPLIKTSTENLLTQSWGGIIIDEQGATSIDGVFAGGDAVSGAATVILAMGAGRKAALGIDKYIKKYK